MLNCAVRTLVSPIEWSENVVHRIMFGCAPGRRPTQRRGDAKTREEGMEALLSEPAVARGASLDCTALTGDGSLFAGTEL